jgi:hypothetical protein
MRFHNTAVLISALLGLVCLQSAAYADAILGATSVTTTMVSGPGYSIDALIDESGLSSTYVSGVTDLSSFLSVTHNSTVTTNDWVSKGQNPTTGNIDFDLGSSVTLDTLLLWNYYPASGVRVVGFTLLASPDSSFTTTTNLGSFTTAPTGTGSAVGLQTFTFAPVTATYIRLEITSNGGATTTGLGEVAFADPDPAAPEPGTWVLLSGGLLALTLFRRR